MTACLTDGPDSPLLGKVRIPTFHVAERLGLVWMFFPSPEWKGPPPPVEADIPEELLARPVSLGGRITERPGDWRYAAENGYDEGHAKYLHRDSLWTLFRRLAAYNRTSVVPAPDGTWITRVPNTITMEADYPGVGHWPRHRWWKGGKGGPRTSIRLPGILRVDYGEWGHYEWYVPTKPGQHRYIQVAAKRGIESRSEDVLFQARYRAYIGWIFHTRFNDQDARMVETMEIPPERLYRPDVSIIAWRKLCESPRGPTLNGSAGDIGTVFEREVEEIDQRWVEANTQ